MKLIKYFRIAAPLLVAGMGLSGNAQADAYAVSHDDVTGGFVDVWQADAITGDACSLIGSGIGGVSTCSAGTTIVNTAAAPLNTSGAAYTFNGAGVSASDGPSLGLVDVAPQQTGTAQANNTYTPVGITGFNYTRGDSVLSSEQAVSLSGGVPILNLTSTIAAENIAESNVLGDNKATADGNVSSGTLMTINISLSTPGQIAFSFDADPFAEATLSADAVFGSVARAILTASVTINSQAPGGGQVFQWSPNGQAGGITGGVEVADPFSLNNTTETQTAGQTVTYDPTNNTFTAYSNALVAGNYTLTLAIGERTEVTSVVAVPEPSTLLLLGIGLGGLGFTRRLRRKA